MYRVTKWEITAWHQIRPKDPVGNTELVLYNLHAFFVMSYCIFGSLYNCTEAGISYKQWFVLSWVCCHIKDEWRVMYCVEFFITRLGLRWGNQHGLYTGAVP